MHAGSWSDVCSGRASQEPSRDSCTLLVLHCTYDSQQTVEKVTNDRVEPAAGPAMSASHPKRPSAMKMRSVAKGQERKCGNERRYRDASGAMFSGSIESLIGLWPRSEQN